jgi:CDP-glucose 4,6-dehydratase
MANITLAEKLADNSELRGEAFNFSNEQQLTVIELVQQILALMKSNLEPEIRNEATNEIRHQYLSAEKARRLLGWRPLFTLEEGLKQTIPWYREFLGASE